MNPKYIRNSKVSTRKQEQSKSIHLSSIYNQYKKAVKSHKLNYYSTDDE